EGKRQYAETTFKKWRSGDVQMGGEISERLIRIVPEFLNFNQKYDLIENLWNRLRQKTTLRVSISPQSGLDAAVAAVMDAVNAMAKQEIPVAVAPRREWLARDDAVAAKALLAQIPRREEEVAIEPVTADLRKLLAVASQHRDKIVTGTRTVTLPGV